MPDILHRVGIKAKAAVVYKALTTTDGLSRWWVLGVSGSPGKKGGLIDFGFNKMKVLEAKPGNRVKWKCVDGPKEWIDTEISFDLKTKQGQTFVLFKHADWKQPVEFMHHCSTKWAVFLLSLKNWLEREEGRPSPYDVKISVGD